MNNLGYQDELEMELMLDEAKEPDLDVIGEDQLEALGETINTLPEKVVIGAFLKWLDRKGYNFWIIEAIRKMLLKGQERKMSKLKQEENIDLSDELTGEMILAG